MSAVRRFAVACGIVLSLAGQATFAQTLHLIAIADSEDATIGEGAAANSVKIVSYLRRVANTLKLDIALQSIEGSGFSCDAIREAVARVKAGKDDIVVFYYSGHGFRTMRSTTTFPSFYCGESEPLTGLPNLFDASRKLVASGARLVIAVADTCNVVMPVAPPAPAKPMAKPAPILDEAQLRSLFMRYRGSLIMSSSTPGQRSWYYPTGGLFTAQLLRAFAVATGPGRVGLWKDVTDGATKPISVQPEEGPPVTQSPQVSDAELVRF